MVPTGVSTTQLGPIPDISRLDGHAAFVIGVRWQTAIISLVAESTDLKWLGPLAAPIAAIAAVLGLAVSFKTYSETLGWKLVAIVAFLISTIWAGWYLLATKTEPTGVLGGEPRRVRRNQHPFRFAVVALPLLILIAGAAGLVYSREPDYSELFVGGGPYTPVVVLDSIPRGAEVSFAWVILADDDPLLENRSEDKERAEKIFRGRTLCRVRVDQRPYWAVFKLGGRTLSKRIEAVGPTVVRANFARGSITVSHPQQ